MPKHTVKGKTYTYVKPPKSSLLDLYRVIGGVIKDNKIYVENDNEEDFFYLLGLVLSDGYDRKKYIYFETSDIELVKIICRSFWKITVKPKYKVLETGKILYSLYARSRYSFDIDDHKLLEMLLNDRDNLSSFLAGLIDGDGSISGSIRLSIRKDSVIYKVLSNLNLLGAYDEKRYIITVKLSKVHDILEKIYSKMKHSRRREKLFKIINRRRCIKAEEFYINLESVSKYELLKILSTCRIERNKNYFYVVYPLREDLLKILTKMFPKDALKIDEKRKRVRIYKREIVRWLAGHSPALCR